ncbi:ECF RNA polymerase sigma factor SigW [Posidoniimonas corsicana]|uniref:ECF RNA polymerase sigma factor SigW n=1 Tax=Posidoniimonas corsicana TaxID=1938618 RepID=A0A5C5UY42_9BACT|nr:sigma-70 family RNA polymerase sigma factor [Posidoniimonas corsicana]TWT30392.1 ECF RNA polymerase sigma factor SigW [Posidoniimonas corsicana]
MPPATDEQLRQRLVDGDDAALGEAFALHRERLRTGLVFRMDRRLRGRLDPDDILQEAFLQASTRLDHFRGTVEKDPDSSLFVWLRLISTQTLIDAHRRHIGAKMRDAGREVHRGPSRNAVATSVSLADCLLGHLTSPSQAAIREELGARLQDAIATMSENDQEIIALRHFEELTNGEVAEALGIEVKAASIRYVRAIKRLKEVVDGIPGMKSFESLLNR